MDALERISRSVNHWVEYVLFGLGFTMSVVVAVQVFFRYALNHSLFWSEELARYILVWLTFLGLPLPTAVTSIRVLILFTLGCRHLSKERSQFLSTSSQRSCSAL